MPESSKKHVRRPVVTCAGGSPKFVSQVPEMYIWVMGMKVKAMVDTGCSRTVLSDEIGKVEAAEGGSFKVIMMNGEIESVQESKDVPLVIDGRSVTMNCLVGKVLDPYKVLLGMDAIGRMGGVSISSNGHLKFGVYEAASVAIPEDENIDIEDQDFVAKFSEGQWKIRWKWIDGKSPKLSNSVSEYKIADAVKSEFDAEVGKWISEGWLKPYDGSCDGVLPLMAVVQTNKQKVRPVLDYRELNEYVSSHTEKSVVCSEKLRNWRQMGTRIKLVDLRRAYLQIRVEPELWKYQVVEYQGKRYCLTRLGFGLNVAPKVMSAVVGKILSMEDDIQRGTDSYIDDIIVNESVVSAEKVVAHLRKYGLESKPAEDLNGCKVLGVKVEKAGETFKWRRGSDVPIPVGELTKRDLFSICGQLIAHYPVGGWLRVACSWIKRQVNVGNWNEKVGKEIDEVLRRIIEKVKTEEPTKGRWDVPKTTSGTLWCDASTLALGVVLEIAGRVVEDATWLRKKNDAGHINLAELEAVLKGLNLAIAWKLKAIEIKCDSQSVCNWLRSALEGEGKVKSHGMGEALVRRRLQVLKDTVEECELKVRVCYVPSCQNKADILTRVPREWMRLLSGCVTKSDDQTNYGCATESDEEAIRQLHEVHHFGVRRTMFFVRKKWPQIDRAEEKVKRVIQSCTQCASIDPAPVRWESGALEVDECWARLAIDVTHYRGNLFLSIIDCGPSRFTIWRPLKSEEAAEIAQHLDTIFNEMGPPKSIIADNSAAFRSEVIRQTCAEWSVTIEFRCVNRPSGNGVVERVHRTIKRMAARSGGKPQRMAFWLNNSPKVGDDERSVPSRQLFNREWWCPGVEGMELQSRPSTSNFQRGEHVFTRPVNARCTQRWPMGTVTGVGPGVQVEVDGLPRHERDVRRIPVDVEVENETEETSEAQNDGRPRYPVRERRQPDRFIYS